MTKKVAKLVTFSITTRVVVDEDAEDMDIIETALLCCVENLQTDGANDHLESIEDDTECPYEEGDDTECPYEEGFEES